MQFLVPSHTRVNTSVGEGSSDDTRPDLLQERLGAGGVFSFGFACLEDDQNAIGALGEYGGIGDGHHRRRIEQDNVGKFCEAANNHCQRR